MANAKKSAPNKVKAGEGAKPKAKQKATDAKRGGKPASRIDKANGKRR